jgi:hypothetical protein
MIMRRATSLVSAATQAEIRKHGRIALIAIVVAVGVTALSVGGAKQARAEPPDPCLHSRCGF